MKDIEITIGSFYKPVTDYGGYAYQIKVDGIQHFFSACYYQTSSQRMEMRAFIDALSFVYSEYGIKLNVTVFTKLESQIRALKRKDYQGSNKDLYDAVFNLPTQIVTNIVHEGPRSDCFAEINKLLSIEEDMTPVKQDRPTPPKSVDLLFGI
jgi:hypothetical protein